MRWREGVPGGCHGSWPRPRRSPPELTTAAPRLDFLSRRVYTTHTIRRRREPGLPDGPTPPAVRSQWNSSLPVTSTWRNWIMRVRRLPALAAIVPLLLVLCCSPYEESPSSSAAGPSSEGEAHPLELRPQPWQRRGEPILSIETTEQVWSKTMLYSPSVCAGSAGTGERALRVSVDAALRAGIFKASGSIDPIGFGDERERGLPRPWSSSR